MTKETILAMTGRDLDAAVAEHVTGHTVRASHGVMSGLRRLVDSNGTYVGTLEMSEADCWKVNSPAYSTDANACRLMETEIERRNLRSSYIFALCDLTGMKTCDLTGMKTTAKRPEMVTSYRAQTMFDLKTASLDLCCRAALLALLKAEEKTP